MNKTLRISFSLRNTYRVNGILYSLKQIPLLKKCLPDALYRVRGLKVFANVVSAIWEILSAFLGKFLYFLILIAGAGRFYEGAPQAGLFLHILVFLTVIGAFSNTYLFNPSRDKYYAIILMGMNAREFALIHYGYSMGKLLVGFLLFATIFGTMAGVPLWLCLLIPFFAAGLKLSMAACSLWDYEKRGVAPNENRLGKVGWILICLLLAAAYGLPALGLLLPVPVCAAVMGLSVAAGAVSVRKILTFPHYREAYQQILTEFLHQTQSLSQAAQAQSRKLISEDTGITSHKKGFAYLHELFVRRHQKILWKSAEKITIVCSFLLLAALLALYLEPTCRQDVNRLLMTFLPYFVFIMYAVNRGTGFTKALFMNCDHSLLTYSFYKQPPFLLKLFQIRLWEIVKINLLPASVIGVGLAALLYASGGTDEPVHYVLLVISILAMSVFFSVHYLTIYYLLQPYNGATEMKSGTYQIILSGTYLVCFLLMRLRMPILLFGLMSVAFCAVYCVAACILVYRLAPRTFRLRT